MSEKKWWEKKEKATYAEWQELKTPEGLDYYYNTVTGVTTWDKPDELKTEEELNNKGEWVWMPNDEQCYIAATIQSRGREIQLRGQDGRNYTLPGNTQFFPLKPASLKRIVADLVLLDDMSTPLILHNLRVRFEKGDIYTNIGTILISVNPYQNLGLYTPEKIYEYQYRGTKEMPPHVFNIAHEAYKGMCDFKKNHSAIISGESGAGKTEATKQVLNYLAAVAGSTNGVEQKVLQANPILEGFGNAKTVRNDNSSRFGKYMEIFFDSANKICGCNTTNYLLEKIRVVQQSPTERNFHVFYQLVKAASGPQRTKYMLAARPDDYFYLKQSGCIDVPTIDDKSDWSEMLAAMNIIGFSAQDQDNVFSATSAVLALGNTIFKGSKPAEQKFLESAAKLLQVETSTLATSLTIRELRIKGQQTTKITLDDKQCSDTRHALAKFIYGNMFDWIVKKVNQGMVAGSGKKLSIGILDIFGFEIFKQNSFEQLCINFTNEMLQQHFNHNTFFLEEQVYASEGIKFKHVDYIDNKPVLDLITNKQGGILSMLDEEIVVPKGSDEGFLMKMHQRHERSTIYGKALKNPMLFVIKHYAGEVTYDGVGFLEKNRDTLTDDLYEMLASSKNQFIRDLFPVDKTGSKKASLAKQFQGQLNDLMAELHKTEPHYIRCVKPNATKSPSTMSPPMTLEQLTYSGVLEAVAIRKQGYPFRLKHDVFVSHFGCIMPDPGKKYSSPVQGCKEIIAYMKLSDVNVKIGTTQILYRADEHKSLELQRSIRVVALEMDAELNRLITESQAVKLMTDPQREKFFEKLSRAVEQADEFRLQSEVSNRARKLLDDYIESRIDDQTKAMLQQAYDAVNEDLLIKALRIVDQHGYKTKLCKRARKLLDRIQRINEEVNIAATTLDEFHVAACVRAADEIKLSTEWLEYLRALVNGPPEDYLTAQYEKAVANKNDDRAIRIDVKRKDLLIEKKGHEWSDLTKYPRLKEASVWAGQKLMGDKQQRIASFLSWQKDKIHAPLCKYTHIADKKRSKELKVKLVDDYSYIMKYLGQRKAKRETGTERARQCVSAGFENVEIRDEIYIHLIKNINGNPDPNAIAQCWDLMSLCMLTFPPTPELENFLEYYIRKNAPSGKQKHQFTGWLRQRCFKGAVQACWTETDLAQIEQTLETRSRGFSEPLPPGQPSWQDLEEPFVVETDKQQFRRTIAVKGGGGGGGGAAAAARGGGGGTKAPPNARKPAPVQKIPWQELVDEESGEVYYWREDTGESQWEKPPELMYSSTKTRI